MDIGARVEIMELRERATMGIKIIIIEAKARIGTAERISMISSRMEKRTLRNTIRIRKAITRIKIRTMLRNRSIRKRIINPDQVAHTPNPNQDQHLIVAIIVVGNLR